MEGHHPKLLENTQHNLKMYLSDKDWMQAMANLLWAYVALRYDCGAALLDSVAAAVQDRPQHFLPQVLSPGHACSQRDVDEVSCQLVWS